MRISFASLLLLAAFPAPAAETCTRWTAQIEETEGGREMVARTCNPAGGEMTAMCGAPGTLMIFYAPVSGDFLPNGNPDFSGRFMVKVDGESFERTMTYQAMDGLMELDLTESDQLMQALEGGRTVTYASLTPGIPEATFTLAGSSSALRTLKATCLRR